MRLSREFHPCSQKNTANKQTFITHQRPHMRLTNELDACDDFSAHAPTQTITKCKFRRTALIAITGRQSEACMAKIIMITWIGSQVHMERLTVIAICEHRGSRFPGAALTSRCAHTSHVMFHASPFTCYAYLHELCTSALNARSSFRSNLRARQQIFFDVAPEQTGRNVQCSETERNILFPAVSGPGPRYWCVCINSRSLQS